MGVKRRASPSSSTPLWKQDTLLHTCPLVRTLTEGAPPAAPSPTVADALFLMEVAGHSRAAAAEELKALFGASLTNIVPEEAARTDFVTRRLRAVAKAVNGKTRARFAAFTAESRGALLRTCLWSAELPALTTRT